MGCCPPPGSQLVRGWGGELGEWVTTAGLKHPLLAESASGEQAQAAAEQYCSSGRHKVLLHRSGGPKESSAAPPLIVGIRRGKR